MRFIVLCDEVDHGDIPLLTVPVATPDALFDTLWIPREVVVDYSLAELKVQPFCASLCTNQDLRTRAELVHERESNCNLATGLRSWRKTHTFFLLPTGVCLLRPFMVIHAAKQRNVVVLKADIQQQASQVLLRGNGLRKNHGLATATTVSTKIKHHTNRFLKRPRFRIVRERARACDEAFDAGQFVSEGFTIHWGRDFFGRFVDLILVLEISKHVHRRFVGV